MELQPTTLRKALATLGLVALFALLGWIVWYVSRAGPAVTLTLAHPAVRQVLPVGHPVVVQGRASNVKGPIQCNGAEARPDGSGRFRFQVEGPGRPGLFTLHCAARNEEGRTYHFRFGRLAGPHAPLNLNIPNAIRAHIPLKLLNAPGGIMAELQQLVSTDLTDTLNRAVSSMRLDLPAVRLGPVTVDRIHLRGIEPAPRNMIRFRLGLQNICLHVGRRTGLWPGWLKRISSLLPKGARICLPVPIPMNVDIKLAPGKPVQVSAGPLTTRMLQQLADFEPILQTGNLLAGLSNRLGRALTWPSRKARSILQALRHAHATLNERLTETTELFRPASKEWTKNPVRVCMKVELDRLFTRPEAGLASFHLSARLYGTAPADRPCARDKVNALSDNHFRIVLAQPGHPRSSRPPARPSASAQPGAPSPGVRPLAPHAPAPHIPWQHKYLPPAFRTPVIRPRPPTGPASPLPTTPTLHISMDLVNAYLAAMWAGNGLAKIPVNMSEAREQGFDVQRASFILPPVVFPEPEGKLRLDAAELELVIRAKGEPRRLFRFNAEVPLRLELTWDGRLKLVVLAEKLTEPSIRCVGELDGTPCSAQSRRYQDLVNVATELMKTGELMVPDMDLQAALPVWQTDKLKVKAKAVRIAGRDIEVELEVRPR